MHTRCPHCQSVLTIPTPENGEEVRCKQCHTPFNALSHKTDHAPEEKEQITTASAQPSSQDTRDGERDTPTAAENTKIEAKDPVPRALHENVTRATTKQTTRKWQFAFGLGALLSCVVLLAQHAWFHSAQLAQRFPQWHPEMEIFCRNTGCRIPVRRDPTRIQIIDRDVRAHPKYKKALLVSARFVNTLPYVQPFPRMQFVLFNVRGQIIAARIFRPKEYLDDDINLAAGMRSDKPIQVVLGILAQEEAAVSFEFTFL
uniref:MJ0042 family finger-like domain-containing protein n=1 Tax=Candidatus Kentrum sp. TUN TaxID=2126343 RepID=A0A451ACU6_9GAMM|nr:MAG: MJ0042 family finger-like domain-containing protein [Candidatus Kentron sp. TUN]VFK55485.1 MAG: MJ0042 family finger-like domain-containing protein [Candidatus Kentron sp. TUN]VFK63842.1 MAG: MJ0042 family finger-like domain-containing protein [Candidatus Kentron sp. TUN]